MFNTIKIILTACFKEHTFVYNINISIMHCIHFLARQNNIAEMWINHFPNYEWQLSVNIKQSQFAELVRFTSALCSRGTPPDLTDKAECTCTAVISLPDWGNPIRWLQEDVVLNKIYSQQMTRLFLFFFLSLSLWNNTIMHHTRFVHSFTLHKIIYFLHYIFS